MQYVCQTKVVKRLGERQRKGELIKYDAKIDCFQTECGKAECVLVNCGIIMPSYLTVVLLCYHSGLANTPPQGWTDRRFQVAAFGGCMHLQSKADRYQLGTISYVKFKAH